MSRVPKLTVDSVLTYQRMNAIRDRLEEILGMLVADHGYDGSVFSTAETRLGKHAWRTAGGSSFSAVGTYLIRLAYANGLSVQCIAGPNESLGPISISPSEYDVKVRLRHPSLLAASATPIDVGGGYAAVASVVVERDSDPSAEWPWVVSVQRFFGLSSFSSNAAVSFVLQVWGY